MVIITQTLILTYMSYLLMNKCRNNDRYFILEGAYHTYEESIGEAQKSRLLMISHESGKMFDLSIFDIQGK